MLVLAISLAACGSIHKYGDTGLSPAESATISGPSGIWIVRIDGVEPKNRPFCTAPACNAGFEIRLAPGTHVIEMQLATGSATSGVIPFRVDVLAGRRYQIVDKRKRKPGGLFDMFGNYYWVPEIEAIDSGSK
jgi:hypothetical protein